MKNNLGGSLTKKSGRIARKSRTYSLSEALRDRSVIGGNLRASSKIAMEKDIAYFRGLLHRRFLEDLAPSRRAEVLSFFHNFIHTPRPNGLYRLPTIDELKHVFPYLMEKKGALSKKK